MSSTQSIDAVVSAVRRQWRRFFLICIASGGIAYFISSSLSQQKVTARLTLSAQPLPATSQNVYASPNPNVAAVLLKSARILQPVSERHNLPPASALGRLVNPFANTITSSIDVALVLKDSEKAILVLNDIANELIKSIVHERKETLTMHARYISGLLESARSELGNGRTKLAQLKESLRLNGDDDSQKTNEYYSLANRARELDSSAEQCLRDQERIQRELQMLSDEFVAVRIAAFRTVVAGRRRQSETLGLRLTPRAPGSAINAEVQRELLAAESELNRSIKQSEEASEQLPANLANDNDRGVSARDSSLYQSDRGPANPASALAAESKSPAESGKDLGRDFRSTDAPEAVADELRKWVDNISAIGRDSLGELEPSILQAVEVSKTKLTTISSEARKLQTEFNNNEVDLEYFQEKTKEVNVVKRTATDENVKLSSTALMELKLDVDEKEKRYSQLSQQLDQINQLRDCELSEYAVTAPAAVHAGEDVSSNRRNLFVCSFLGCGLLLSAPLVFTEIQRLRPAPVKMISRRWNLPILGTQATNLHLEDNPSDNAMIGRQDVRLMALRIQQSLSRPGGRVVLFSGLDHEESPLNLIQSTACCLAQREEKVLIIQMVPTRGESGVGNNYPGYNHQTIPSGVAELLAGSCENASSLVTSTDTPGVDFLPGGGSGIALEAMASSRLSGFIEQFRDLYSMIILCGPSTLHPADLQMLAARADGIVFTVNHSSVRSIYGDEVIGDLIELGAPILGLAEQPASTPVEFRESHDTFSAAPRNTLMNV